MKADFNHDVTDPQLVATPNGTGALIRFQTVDQPASGPQRSGKYIHLSLTPKVAMDLLVLLDAYRKEFDLPTTVAVRDEVPGPEGRH